MFSFFRKPKPEPKPEPKPDYIIEANGYGYHYISRRNPFGELYFPLPDSFRFDSYSEAEVFLLEYLNKQGKLKRRVVCEIFIEKEKS